VERNVRNLDMSVNLAFRGLDLTEAEAFALLDLAVTSPQELNAEAEQAIQKLAALCKQMESIERPSN